MDVEAHASYRFGGYSRFHIQQFDYQFIISGLPLSIAIEVIACGVWKEWYGQKGSALQQTSNSVCAVAKVLNSALEADHAIVLSVLEFLIPHA
ncbi:hypothetical protein J3P96_15940 [Pseudomonas sp. R3-56]|uniref:hypothetical protein n=1 Tax=Pseudomonas sp. R3-56 TaxID=2817401 RepID=UPI003DAA144B